MQKILIGFFIGIALAAGIWLLWGRPDTSGLRRDLDEVNGTFKEVQRTVTQVESHAERITDLVTAIDQRSLSALDRSLDLVERSGSIEGDLLRVQDGVESVTIDNRELIKVGRGISDEAYELRQYIKDLGEE